jgi:hypothetical protein
MAYKSTGLLPVLLLLDLTGIPAGMVLKYLNKCR